MEIRIIPNPVFMARALTSREVHMVQGLLWRLGYENINNEVLIDQLSEKHYYLSLRVTRVLDDITVQRAAKQVSGIYGVRLEVTGYRHVCA